MKYKKGLSPLEYYCPKHSAVCEIVNRIEKNLSNRVKQGFSEGLIKSAQKEIFDIKNKLDGPTFLFSQDLNYLVFGLEAKTRAIMLTSGIFYGKNKKSIKSIIPKDLGTNPYQLFNRQCEPTTDAYVTDTETEKFLRIHRDEILAQGYNHFDITASNFFYLRDDTLAKFKDNNEQDTIGLSKLFKLVPLISYVEDSIVTKKVTRPSHKEYNDNVHAFTSYRFKQSFIEKLIRGDLITDWVAHSIGVSDKEIADIVEKSLLSGNPFGKGESRIKQVLAKDDVELKRGYKAKKLKVVTESPGFEDCVRSIQIVTTEDYFWNEIDITKPQSRHRYKETKGRAQKKKTEIDIFYENILRQIFHDKTTSINIEDLVLF